MEARDRWPWAMLQSLFRKFSVRNTLYLQEKSHAAQGALLAVLDSCSSLRYCCCSEGEGGKRLQAPRYKQMRNVALVQLGSLAQNGIAAKQHESITEKGLR